jgi:hypothetical protein
MRYVLMPLMQVWRVAKRCALWVIPSCVMEVVVIDPKTHDAWRVYDALTHRFGWHRAHHHIRYLSPNVFYYIRVWDSDTMSLRAYFLNAAHLCCACGIRDINYLWALSDFGIADALSTYAAEHNESNDIFDISVNGKCVLQKLTPIFHSLHIPENVTFGALVLLLMYMGYFGEDYDVSEFVRPKIVLTDYELEEKEVSYAEYLVPGKKPVAGSDQKENTDRDE